MSDMKGENMESKRIITKIDDVNTQLNSTILRKEIEVEILTDKYERGEIATQELRHELSVCQSKLTIAQQMAITSEQRVMCGRFPILEKELEELRKKVLVHQVYQNREM